MSNSGGWLSVYLLIPALAWFVAQTLKMVFELSKPVHQRNKKILRSGSMPSAHSATMAALLTVVGMRQGVDSGLFGVVAVLTAIILYDAINVRRAVGEQGEVLKQIAPKKLFYTAQGHKLVEILAGLLIGVITAYGLLQIL